MRYKYIDVRNNIDKAIAFCPSLDVKNVKNQNIKIQDNYISSLDIIDELSNKGWELKGVKQDLAKRDLKYQNHHLQFHHKDLALNDVHGSKHSKVSLRIMNSCDGSAPLNADLGMFRLVCSNGMIRRDKLVEFEVNNNSMVNNLLRNIDNQKYNVIGDFAQLQQRDLSPNEVAEFLFNSAKFVYDKPDKKILDEINLITRVEDEGDNLFNVFNRIQENLTRDISDMSIDAEVNKHLFDLAKEYV